MLPHTADPFADTQRFDLAAVADTQKIDRDAIAFAVRDEMWFAQGDEQVAAPVRRTHSHWRCAARALCVLVAASAIFSAIACVM